MGDEGFPTVPLLRRIWPDGPRVSGLPISRSGVPHSRRWGGSRPYHGLEQLPVVAAAGTGPEGGFEKRQCRADRPRHGWVWRESQQESD
jgi:hypothetical protein